MRITASTHGAVPLFDPVVDVPRLHHDVPALRCTTDRRAHVDLARDDHDVVDRIGAVIARRRPGANSMMRKIVPFFRVVATLRSPRRRRVRYWPEIPSVVQILQAVRAGRPDATFLETSVDLHDRLAGRVWPVITRRTAVHLSLLDLERPLRGP